MNSKKYHIVAAAVLLTSCASDFDQSYQMEKPAEVTAAEQLSGYKTLLEYVEPAMRLGNTLTLAAFQEEGTATTLTMANFNELTLSDAFLHSKLVDATGTIDSAAVAQAGELAAEKGIALFGTSLCSNASLNTDWLNSLIAPEFVELDEMTGSDVWDFEADETGKTYGLKKSTGEDGKGNAVVEDDPDGQSGKVLHVTKTNQSFPAFTLQLPEGRKLGDYKKVRVDLKAINKTAVNQPFVFSMAGKPVEFKKPAEYGCEVGAWGRGLIEISLEAMNFDDSQQALTTVELIMGPKLMNCDYLIDNIELVYNYKPSYYQEKTAEEKVQILSAELGRYISRVTGIATGVDSWVVADHPVTAPADAFWKANLGDDYVATAASMARRAQGSAKLFVTEQLADPAVRADFLSLLSTTDDVDGIDAEVVLDEQTLQSLPSMLSELAATGLLVRLNIQGIVAPGETAGAALVGNAVKCYSQTVPQSQRYGLSFAAVCESATNVGLWTSGYNRKQSFASLADALQGR